MQLSWCRRYVAPRRLEDNFIFLKFVAWANLGWSPGLVG